MSNFFILFDFYTVFFISENDLLLPYDSLELLIHYPHYALNALIIEHITSRIISS